jgi:Na+/H+-dicarboxylate symporter
MAKINFLDKLPKMFLGLIIGITFGAIAGTIFDDMGFVQALPWEEIFIFLGAMFGAIIGDNE